MRLGQDSAEQIRRHEVTRALKKVNLSPEVAEVIERLHSELGGCIVKSNLSLRHGPTALSLEPVLRQSRDASLP